MKVQLGSCVTALALAATLGGCASDDTTAAVAPTGQDAAARSPAPVAGGVRDPASAVSGADGSSVSDNAPGRTPAP